MSDLRLSVCVGALAMMVPFVAHAQLCTNLSGSPAPTPEVYAANAVFLKYLSTGPGGGDDKPQLHKSASNNPSFVGLDLANVHSIAVTIRLGSGVGPVMWSATIPAASGLWASVTLPSGVVRWTFTDPAVTYGVKKARVLAYPGGIYIVDKFFGANANIGNAPVPPGVAVHAMVEIYDGLGAGTCYDGVTQPCTGTGNTQKCRV
ncbi:MAG: hypothetical protein U0807_19555 [Candidatus Binatia bacterium]